MKTSTVWRALSRAVFMVNRAEWREPMTREAFDALDAPARFEALLCVKNVRYDAAAGCAVITVKFFRGRSSWARCARPVRNALRRLRRAHARFAMNAIASSTIRATSD